ncbi:sensor histidine kinase [Bradyrhizobium jicamae]|uniref:histidine kinase n=1 Tax=Bradyrhizobium jicamae TaxID=280332 RepID=A0ABS5FY88_9BRAD|nr:sensor histidine kinase [Bradyrhizobium jicamae]MBR0801794.1 sensor histidine kinase [Bradyrhizobium jicamae]MBR0938968.1 sensor histidine kinase [Bradyrhizobium jicamae]
MLPKSRGTIPSEVQADALERPHIPWLDLGKTGRRNFPARMVVRPQRIRTYLVLFALALSLPLLCVSVFGLHRMASIEEAQTDNRIVAFVQNLAVDVDKELDRAIVTLETLANSSELSSGNLRGFHNQALITSRPRKAAIVLLDKSYRQLVDTLSDYGTPLPPTAEPATAKRVIETGRPQVSGVFKGSINGLYIFNVEIPVFDADRQVKYVLMMSFRASYISDILNEIHYPPGWISGVTDQNGIILARSDRPEEYVGKPLPTELFERTKAGEGVYQATNIAGIPILRSTARSKHAGWYVSLGAPLTYVQAPRWRSYAIGAAVLVTAVVLGWALAYFFGLLMARPLDEATRIAKSVSQNEIIEPTTTSLIEANILIATLAEASAELRSRTDYATYLMRELAHRAKNQLAVVKGMAVQTARRSADVSQFIVQFDRRIHGLAQSQDVLLRQDWRGASLFDLARAHLDLFGVTDRVRMEGPNLLLNAAAAQNLGFALHELATNAAKHGALSVPTGEILIRSNWSGEGTASLSWIETGGPPVHDPPQNGFGYRVITELVPAALNGSAKLEFAEAGIRWQQDIPSSNILAGDVEHV